MARSHGRSVAVRPEMLKASRASGLSRHFLDRLLQHVTVDQADEAQLLDRGHEIAGQHHLAVLADHAQQAFVMVGGAGVARHHRLIGEDQAVVLERALHPLAQRHAETVAAALLLGDLVGHEAIAAGALGLGQRGFGAGHDVVGGLGLLGERRAADRDGGIDRAGDGVDRHLAHRGQDLLGGDGGVLLGAIRQHDAEAVAADAADDVAHPEAAVEPLADLDDDRIRRLVAEGVVDVGELVDADREIGAAVAGARARGDDVVERLAQPLLVVMAGELVVAGEMLEPLLGRLAPADEPQHAQHARGLAGLVGMDGLG